MFVRDLPPTRSFLLCAGLEHVIRYLGELRFTADQIAYLRSQPVFRRISADFRDYLAEFRFTGSVQAAPEGAPVRRGSTRRSRKRPSSLTLIAWRTSWSG